MNPTEKRVARLLTSLMQSPVSLNAADRLVQIFLRVLDTAKKADSLQIETLRPEKRVTKPEDRIEKYEPGPVIEYRLRFTLPDETPAEPV